MNKKDRSVGKWMGTLIFYCGESLVSPLIWVIKLPLSVFNKRMPVYKNVKNTPRGVRFYWYIEARVGYSLVYLWGNVGP